jgi:hypothetical protein
MRLSEYQRSADATDVSSRAPWVGLNQNLFGLVEKVGLIAHSVKCRMRDKGSYSKESFRADVETAVGESLWYLSAVCTHFHLDLEQIAIANLQKNRERWGTHRDEQGALFHGRNRGLFRTGEYFPESVLVRFTSIEGPNQHSWMNVTAVTVDGEEFGDRVDDNSRYEDGYRYHDILHFAFAAYLDWSPVVRKLLRNKRKSDPLVDKFDDGARARDTEEAVSNLIHHNARVNNYYAAAKHLDTKLLTGIQLQVMDLEVRDRTPAEWEAAILAAYAAFRELRDLNGGTVQVFFDPPKLVVLGTRADNE